LEELGLEGELLAIEFEASTGHVGLFVQPAAIERHATTGDVQPGLLRVGAEDRPREATP